MHPRKEPKSRPSPASVSPRAALVNSSRTPRTFSVHSERGAVTLGGLLFYVGCLLIGGYLIVHLLVALIGWRGVVAAACVLLFVFLLSAIVSADWVGKGRRP